MRNYPCPKLNETAIVDPTITDDISGGWEILSGWINTLTQEAFICISNARGAAKWAFAGSISPNGSSVLTNQVYRAREPVAPMQWNDAQNIIANQMFGLRTLTQVDPANSQTILLGQVFNS